MNVPATYPLYIAAKAAGFTERQFLRKRDHGFLRLRGCDRPSTGSGEPVGYSRNRILEAATMKWLGALRVPASTASAAALKFSDEAQTGRAAGECFEHGKTILVISPEGATVKATVKNVLYGATLADATNRGVCTITLDMNKIVQTVDEVLKNERTK